MLSLLPDQSAKPKASAAKAPKATTNSRATAGSASKTASTARAKAGQSTTTTLRKKPLKPKENVVRDDSDEGDDAMEIDEGDNFDDAPKPKKTVTAPNRQGKDASDIYQSVRPYVTVKGRN